jgi:hypothetical protein
MAHIPQKIKAYPPIACETCGGIFTPLAPNARYCSVTCKIRAERQRSRERGKARRSLIEAEQSLIEGTAIAANPNTLPTNAGEASNEAVSAFLSTSNQKCTHTWARVPSDGSRICSKCGITEG